MDAFGQDRSSRRMDARAQSVRYDRLDGSVNGVDRRSRTSLCDMSDLNASPRNCAPGFARPEEHGGALQWPLKRLEQIMRSSGTSQGPSEADSPGISSPRSKAHHKMETFESQVRKVAEQAAALRTECARAFS